MRKNCIIAPLAVIIYLCAPGNIYAQTVRTSGTRDIAYFKNPFHSFLPKKPVVDTKTQKQSTKPTTKKPVQQKVEPPIINLPQFTISGVIWNTERPQAIINNRVVGIGDTVAEARIVAIRKTGIDINYRNTLFTLKTEDQ